MEPQKPAEGIMKQQDYGDSKWYTVECQCHSPECSTTMEVEANDCGIHVNMYANVKTAWWTDHCYRHFDWLPYSVKYYINRGINSFAMAWHAIIHGYVKTQAVIVLNEQSALNLSATLINAIADVQMYSDERKAKFEAEQKAKNESKRSVTTS
jgi:hypothetical protein